VYDVSLSFVILTGSSAASYKLIIYRIRIEYDDPRCIHVGVLKAMVYNLKKKGERKWWLTSPLDISVDSITPVALQGQMPWILRRKGTTCALSATSAGSPLCLLFSGLTWNYQRR